MSAEVQFSDAEIIAGIRKAKGLIYVAAEEIGCSAMTIYRRKKDSQAVRDELSHQRGRFVDTAEQKLAAAIDAGEGWAIALVVKTLGKKRGYVERIEQTGKNGGPIQNQELTEGDRERRLSALAERIRQRRAGLTHANGTGGSGAAISNGASHDGMGGNLPPPSDDLGPV